MTDEELDLLASSFLDGEATPDEVAMFERDPALMERVEDLRVAQSAVRAPVSGPSMQVKEDQLAAAMSAFDLSDRRTTVTAVDDDPPSIETVEHSDDPDPVIDLRSRRNQREEREAAAAGRMRWLSAVAGVLVFTAGAVFLVSQVTNGGGDSEFAGDVPVTDAGETETESAEAQLAPASDDGAADTAAEADVADGADEAMESEAMEADAEEDFAMESEEAADEEADDEGAADESTADAASEPTIRDLAEEGFFGDEPVATYRTIPTSDELLADLDLPWRDPESSMCAGQADLPDNARIIGYLPIEVPATGGDANGSDSQVVEALYLTVGNESQVILVDLDTCEAL